MFSLQWRPTYCPCLCGPSLFRVLNSMSVFGLVNLDQSEVRHIIMSDAVIKLKLVQSRFRLWIQEFRDREMTESFSEFYYSENGHTNSLLSTVALCIHYDLTWKKPHINAYYYNNYYSRGWYAFMCVRLTRTLHIWHVMQHHKHTTNSLTGIQHSNMTNNDTTGHNNMYAHNWA